MDISEYQAYEGVCPRCNAIWGMDELDQSHCYSCGYPDEEEFDSDYEDYFDEDEQPTCSCEFCYCHAPVSVAGAKCNDCYSGAHQG
jgi:Zn ribbon nucleic-acid-binding protein